MLSPDPPFRRHLIQKIEDCGRQCGVARQFRKLGGPEQARVESGQRHAGVRGVALVLRQISQALREILESGQMIFFHGGGCVFASLPRHRQFRGLTDAFVVGRGAELGSFHDFRLEAASREPGIGGAVIAVDEFQESALRRHFAGLPCDQARGVVARRKRLRDFMGRCRHRRGGRNSFSCAGAEGKPR